VTGMLLCFIAGLGDKLSSSPLSKSNGSPRSNEVAMWLNEITLIFLNVNIGCTHPNSEVRDI